MIIALGIVCFVASIYLVAGALFALRVVRRGLPHVDPRMPDGPMGYTVLPGIALLWPWLMPRLHRPRPEGARGPRKAGGPVRLLASAALALLTIAPLAAIPVVITQRPHREDHLGAVPPDERNEPPFARRRVAFGQVFPSIPMDVSLAKGLGHFGLRFDTRPDVTSPPGLLAWAPELNAEGTRPVEAVPLGMIGGTRGVWIPLPNGGMRSSGLWVMYEPLSGRTELYDVSVRQREERE